MKKKKAPGNGGITSDVMKIGGSQVIKYMTKVYNEILKSKEIPMCRKEAKDTLPEKKVIDGLKDAQNDNQGQEEEIGADQKQDGWMTLGKQQGKQQATMAEEGRRSEEMDDICRGLHPAVDGQSLLVTKYYFDISRDFFFV
ncbi:hypothetical protein PoB_003003500 [Plakobranchus ocellatus]|uniref:Uncharacterized protein n=1 Tax=Plakobranchus ocellatus TaxID=259542 RepID=A0AAV4A825_9GAST|nr:hypothetical protein PoB_003003500 [Plakobranchus ocellatus]